MENITGWLAALGSSYLIGSIPTAYLVVKKIKQVDVRTVGSGNAGATNVTRAAGFKAGLFVFLVDVLKGVAAVKLISPLWLAQESLAPFACGISAVVGHIAPVFLGFKGGKGVATTIGVIASAMPSVALIYLAVWTVVFALWRYVSLASIFAMAALPLGQALMGQSHAELAAGIGLAALIIIKHRANIERLRQGGEHRFGR